MICRKASTLALVLALALPSSAQVLIDFENLTVGDVITTQYPEVTFSTTAGDANYAHGFGGGIILCTGPFPGSVTCTEDTYMDFTVPVNDLTFTAIEPNFCGLSCRFRIFENGTHTATVDFQGLCGTGNKAVDLSAFSNVTRLEIVDIVIDPTENGIGWDDFRFTPIDIFTYCTAKVNSCGSLPTVSWSGAPSATAPSGFTVDCSNVKAGKVGFLLYGDTGPAAFPFQGGLLCVNPPIRRTTAVADSTGTPPMCNGAFSIDMNTFAQGGLGGSPAAFLLVPGTVVNGQFWGRDTPGNSLLSDGIEYPVGP